MRIGWKLPGILLVPLVLSCGSSPTATIRVNIASEIFAEDPLNKVAADMEVGLSRGIFFLFKELKCPPATIRDYKDEAANGYAVPDFYSGDQGSDPRKSSYTIDTSGLKPNAFYRVSMFAFAADGSTTYEGEPDCPLYLALGKQNTVKICLGGPGSVVRTCVDPTPWGACPAPADISQCGL